MRSPRRVSLRVRAFVWVFIATFFVCGLARIEAWPFTGWLLFSASRTEMQTSIEAVAAGANGVERPMPFERMGTPFLGSVQALSEFPRLSNTKRLAVCAAWRSGAHPFEPDLAEIRIYRVVRHLEQRDGARGAQPASKTLLFTCTADTVVDVAS